MNNEPDLSPYNLMIAIPSMDGKLETTFVHSLVSTHNMLAKYGAIVHIMEHKYCADVYLARTRLLNAFLREKEGTHLLFIDADMGWVSSTVAYMLLLNRDLLAVAGPKKKYPIEFAFQLCNAEGKPMPLYHELETNVAEVSGVGGAFMLISRKCAQKIVDSHPELLFMADSGTEECGVFDPVYVGGENGSPRRRLSEDYSFCQRWRDLGGKVEVLLDATLTHTGAHTFTGNLYNNLCERDPTFAAPVDQIKAARG